MRIGIDARFYGVAVQGLGRYCEQLVRHAVMHDARHSYIVFVSPGQTFEGLPQNVQLVESPFRWYGLAEQTLWPLFLYRYKLDLMHFTSFNVPLLYRGRFIVTLHDLILMHYPSAHASTLQPLIFALKRFLYRRVIRHAARRAATIIAVSQYTAQDIRDTLRVVTPIRVIYLGSSLPEQLGTTQSEGFALPKKPYFLYVGNAYPHKNLEFMIGGFLQWQTVHSDFSLVLAGRTDYFYDRLKARFAGSAALDWRGQASDADLRELYTHATGYIIPSLYEGFGIPPLEAMRYGIPVLASNASCIPEILGNAAQYFDPQKEATLITALSSIVDDADLRADLQARGFRQAQKYSWESMGASVLELYAELEKQYTSTRKQTLDAAQQEKKID